MQYLYPDPSLLVTTWSKIQLITEVEEMSDFCDVGESKC